MATDHRIVKEARSQETVSSMRLSWLFQSDDGLTDDEQLTLAATFLTPARIDSLLTAFIALSLLPVAALVNQPGTWWPVTWIIVNVGFIALRKGLARRARAGLAARSVRAFEQLMAANTLWYAVSGIYLAAFVSTNNLMIGAFAGVSAAGISAGTATRSNAFPRLANLQDALVSIPFMIAAACSSVPWFFIFGIERLAGMYANIQLVKGHHRNLIGLMHAEEHNRFLALHDVLTGLPNRQHLSLAIEELISRHAGGGGEFVILGLDLDGFKNVNDRFGHPAGDDLLRAVAERLRGALRDGDIVARTGGDEFVALLAFTDAPEAQRIAARIIAAIAAPFMLSAGTVTIGVTIGSASFPADGTSETVLLARADTALYAAKHARRGTYLTYAGATA